MSAPRTHASPLAVLLVIACLSDGKPRRLDHLINDIYPGERVRPEILDELFSYIDAAVNVMIKDRLLVATKPVHGDTWLTLNDQLSLNHLLSRTDVEGTRPREQ
ncbi:hypothetical protein ACIBG8_54510 [Nonomuraea sp. NPDC050556]|uniref:hypothetical protein n=1 Tax=Nonomuraea sp. NPDC050556 TaxID=3364369 RepID=UPI0037A8FED1